MKTKLNSEDNHEVLLMINRRQNEKLALLVDYVHLMTKEELDEYKSLIREGDVYGIDASYAVNYDTPTNFYYDVMSRLEKANK